MTTTPSEVTLEPCPHCGEADAYIERADYSSCYVVCNDCGARGPASCNENEEDCAAEDAGMEPGENAARRLWNTRAALTSLPRDEAIEEAAKVAEDHTPGKHEGTLAAHVTGVTIARAIRALKSSTPTSGEASAPPPLSEQTVNAGAGPAPGSAAEGGAGADVERVAEAIWSEQHYASEKPMVQDCGNISKQHPDDIERAHRQARAALASSPEQRLREALEDFCRAAEYWAGCDENCTPDAATSEIMSSGGAWPAQAYERARHLLERNPHG